MTFPYNEDFIAESFQQLGVTFVAEDVAAAFGLPEFFACLGGDFTIAAIMHMPETAVNEDDFFVFDKDDIGMAGEVTAMEGITITHLMNYGTNDYFR